MQFFAVAAVITSNQVVRAQTPSAPAQSELAAPLALARLYGTNACTATRETKIVGEAGKISLTESFALLDGNTRVEYASSQMRRASLAPMDLWTFGFDRVTVLRADLQQQFVIFPQFKAFSVVGSSSGLAQHDGEAKIELTDLGEEEVEGHRCTKRRAVIATATEKREVQLWVAPDLRNFPIRIRFTEGGNTEISTFKNIQFLKPEVKLFELPAGFTACTNFQEIMERSSDMKIAELPGVGDAKEQGVRLEPLVEFTLRAGTNRPVSSNTAKAFGLGDLPIPAKQIMIGSKEEPMVCMFGVSARNSNDLFAARIDQHTRSGIVWLTSPAGIIRSTILISSNGPPTPASNEEHAEEFQAHIANLLRFSEPPPWEDALHPLTVAAQFGELADVKEVLRLNPKEINTRDDEGQTPLAAAVVQERTEVVRFLLDQGADPEIPNKNGLTPLEHACGRSGPAAMELAESLLAKGAQVNPTNKTDFATSPLEWAVTSDNTKLVKLLLERGANAKAATKNGDTALHTAADRGDLEIAELLVAHGANVNAKIVGGTTPLHKAAWSGEARVAEFLIAIGAELDPKLTTGCTPLLYSAGPGAERKGPACLELLLSKGASLEATDENGGTVLHQAVSYGNKGVVESLLAHGAKVNARNKDGLTPLKVARNPDIAELLRQHGGTE